MSRVAASQEGRGAAPTEASLEGAPHPQGTVPVLPPEPVCRAAPMVQGSWAQTAMPAWPLVSWEPGAGGTHEAASCALSSLPHAEPQVTVELTVSSGAHRGNFRKRGCCPPRRAPLSSAPGIEVARGGADEVPGHREPMLTMDPVSTYQRATSSSSSLVLPLA